MIIITAIPIIDNNSKESNSEVKSKSNNERKREIEDKSINDNERIR